MNRLILSFLYLSMFIYETRSITCIKCSSTNYAGCADPFNATGLIPVPNQTYCEKVVNVDGVIQRSGSATCSISGITGVTSVYCCSDQNNCNNSNNISSTISFLILCLFSKLIS